MVTFTIEAFTFSCNILVFVLPRVTQELVDTFLPLPKAFLNYHKTFAQLVVSYRSDGVDARLFGLRHLPLMDPSSWIVFSSIGIFSRATIQRRT